MQSSRAGMCFSVVGLAVLTVVFAGGPLTAAPKERDIELVPIGTYASGIFNAGGAEIVAYDERTERVFAVNAQAAAVDVLDVSTPASPGKVAAINVAATLAAVPGFAGTVGGVNGIAAHKGVLAVAVEANPKTANGWAAFYDAETLELLGWVGAGALPDMITFTPNGKMVLVANEGEPNSYGQANSVDPEGSVTVVEMKGNFKKLSATTIDFRGFDGQEAALRAQGIRIFGPGASASRDFEPEYIAVTQDGHTAFVTLQENNAVAVLDLKRLTVARLLPLGFKDHSAAGNGLDGSDRDGPGNAGRIQIANWPVFGMYMPDGVAAYRVKGRDYFVTANEGDSRQDWFAEDARVKDLALDTNAFPNATDLKNDDFIGRLTVTRTLGDANNDGKYEALYAFGGRSFSIWDEDGNRVFDSGDQFERITSAVYAANFNSDHAGNEFDTRSDNKGPEPEGVALGEIKGRTFAFIGLERIGGVMVYDVTDPKSARFVQYVNRRDFTGSPAGGTAGDLGPEGLAFISASESPNGRPLLAVGNEVSGTTTLYEIKLLP